MMHLGRMSNVALQATAGPNDAGVHAYAKHRHGHKERV